eukprot:CAMPEP_0197878402 /NCGR_PEP_ID=MMETSP1439-20131203/6799_1 /TAXON_ID=66791 /ORGANISM="Gonyaulax spinifera, Strain CCMP409" /LENGTH=99 /DNA_ID=CAMNT_0043497811 /DNA_START=26 /DNA_END=325 /DNA_ORIENTATION=-
MSGPVRLQLSPLLLGNAMLVILSHVARARQGLARPEVGQLPVHAIAEQVRWGVLALADVAEHCPEALHTERPGELQHNGIVSGQLRAASGDGSCAPGLL